MARLSLCLFLVLAFLCGPAGAGDEPCIMAGTATTADVLRDLTGDRAEIRQLIPGGACPGHYDLRPGDLLFLEEADLLVLEAYQPEMANMVDLIRAAGNADLQVFVLPLEMEPMLPQGQGNYTAVLAAELIARFPDLADQVAAGEAQRVEMIRHVAEREAARLEIARGTPTLCSCMQAGFAAWAGLEVVGTYGRPEDLTPEKYAQLLETGREEQVRLVLDNFQSGPGAGDGLAESLGAGQADLTNFPAWGPKEERDWASAFTGNVQRLLDALEESGS